MEIKITKKNNRNRLICKRDGGSIAVSDLGPNVPFHDMAHFVVENTLGLKEGFFGNIRKGYSVEDLSDKQVIKTLGPETWYSEIMTRTLQSLSSGACTADQFPALIKEELQHLSIPYSYSLTPDLITGMETEYRKLLEQWKELKEGDTLVLEFEPG
jgi:hypothetical protein